ncbi:MAG: LysR family transcriptional regulator [Deltaproteobacteria bacterium]|nr:MAG: LysR family transcriptional regulator [Deltaproteobacteria bacterium]
MSLESVEELRVFAQIVESGSLAAASRALGMPPNTVGRRIAALEERLGTRLLNRTTRSVSLSEYGRVFIGSAQRILDAVDDAEATLRREREGLTGVVRLGIPSLLAADVVHSLAPLLLANPDLRLEIAVHDRPVNPVSVGLDVLVIGAVLEDSSLVARKLHDLQLVLAASDAYLSRFGEPQTPAELANHRTVHFRRNPPETAWTLTDAAGEQHVVAVNGRFEADDGRALIDAMRAGLGIGSTSQRVLRAHPELRRVLPGFTGVSFPIYAIYPASGQRSARLQAVVSTLAEVVTRDTQGHALHGVTPGRG